MKSPAILLFALLLCSLSCDRGSQQARVVAEPESKATAQKAEGFVKADLKTVSLSDADSAESTTAAFDRKIIRNADLTMEVASTTETQHRIVSIAEAHGGFVVTSEAKQKEDVEPAKRSLDVKLMVRVPADQFGTVLDKIRAQASNLKEENVSGQDVTEEFIDLEARIKTQKALEQQFLQIMKQAGRVSDALEVQRQIAEVRTEIEKLEGRKRFLQNRASLSTITVNLQTPKPIVVVSTTGFGRSVKDAISESLDVGSGIILFFVRFVIVMIPIFALVLLPGGLLVRYFMRRAKRMRLADALASPVAE